MTQPNKCWYEFTATAGNAADIFIYDAIGAYGVSAQAFVADLARHQNKAVTLRINSPGGSVTDASAIFNSLLRHKGGLTAQIDGLCASAATFIACAAGKVKMAANALFMIHDPATTGGGGTMTSAVSPTCSTNSAPRWSTPTRPRPASRKPTSARPCKRRRGTAPPRRWLLALWTK